MDWKIQTIENSLREIHPTFTKALIVDGQIEIYFSEINYPSIASGFVYGSETRNLLEELEEILLEQMMPREPECEKCGHVYCDCDRKY